MLFINHFITNCFNFIPNKSVNNLYTIYNIFKNFVELFLGHGFIQSLHKYIENTYCAKGCFRQGGDSSKKQTAIPVFMELHFSEREKYSK